VTATLGATMAFVATGAMQTWLASWCPALCQRGNTGTLPGASNKRTRANLNFLERNRNSLAWGILTTRIWPFDTTSRLWDNASGAYTILRDYKPPMSRAEYLTFQRGINRTETFDGAL